MRQALFLQRLCVIGCVVGLCAACGDDANPDPRDSGSEDSGQFDGSLPTGHRPDGSTPVGTPMDGGFDASDDPDEPDAMEGDDSGPSRDDGSVEVDECPDDPSKTEPGECGCGRNERDSDDDGVPDCNDECDDDPNKVDEGECGCGIADEDSDEDGTLDCDETCDEDPAKRSPGRCGCGVADSDSDSDGTLDCEETCDQDSSKTDPGVCGCGVSDTDADSDETPDCDDECPNDSGKTEPGACGCGMPDADSDSDETLDCDDECPNDPNKTSPGVCDCGAPDTDSDLDETVDCFDDCPDDPDKTELGACGCGMPDTDSDFDEVPDCVDNCVDTGNFSQDDSDEDGLGDACDACNDFDRDGYGDGTAGNEGCDGPEVDCDDRNGGLSPGAFEVCDEADNDCDENVDEDARCHCSFEASESAWIDIGETGQMLSALEAQNDASQPIELPFELPYFGGVYTSLHVSTNGFLVVGASSAGAASPDNTSLPDASEPNAVIAPFWDDLDVSDGSVLYQVIGESPDRIVVVTWNAVRFAADPETQVTFQAQVFENGELNFQYRDTSNTEGSYVDGSSASLGLENPDGSHAVQHAANEAVVSYPMGLYLVCDDCPDDPEKIEPGACGCGVPDVDTDFDEVPDCDDQCPGAPDIDSDSDHTLDCLDGCPLDSSKTEPGICDCGTPDTDSDADETMDCLDNCPLDPGKTEPGICDCGTADTDSDFDETADCLDNCPLDSNKTEPGICDCGTLDTDSDNDETADCIDGCADDPNKTEPGQCDCGTPDTDSDSDETADCIDSCPDDPNKTEPGQCDCGFADDDFDEDGTADCLDLCGEDPDKIDPGVCGCHAPDDDLDSDQAIDCVDNCPGDTNPGQEDSDGDGLGDACDECTDSDGDGFGDGQLGNVGCVEVDVDCDPTDGRIYPRAVEVCDAEDNDCDIAADEGDPDSDGLEGCACYWMEIEPSWNDIRTSGTHVTSIQGSDDAGAPIDLGFNMPFFGNSYTSAYVSTNGFLAMDAGSAGDSISDYSNDPIPRASQPNGIVAPFWDDLYNDGNGIYYELQGDSPNRQMVVTWDDVRFFSDGDSRITFQAILNESGPITYQYLETDNPAGPYIDGNSASIGIEDHSGRNGVAYASSQHAVPYPHAITLVCSDYCPFDETKTEPGLCGCNVPDDGADRDEDGTPDCVDLCPDDPGKTVPGWCGCEVPDAFEPAEFGWQPHTNPGNIQIPFEDPDAGWMEVPLPFPYPLAGGFYETVWVSPNGMISVDPISTEQLANENASMPDGALPNGLIAPFWDDLIDDGGGVYVAFQEDTRVVFTWVDMSVVDSPGTRVTFQVGIEPNGVATYQYLETNMPGDPASEGTGATIGIESADGQLAIEHSFDADGIDFGTAIALCPTPRIITEPEF